MRIEFLVVIVLGVAASALLMSGCHLPDVPPTKQVPNYLTETLPPLDFKKLSGGKITHYFPSTSEPNNSADEAMLEACRELLIKNATARSASIVIDDNIYGKMPIHALVVNNTTVLLEVGAFVRALRLGISARMPEILYAKVSITLTPKSKWAVVGNKKSHFIWPIIGHTTGIV